MRHRLIGASLLLAAFILLPNLGAQAPNKKGTPITTDSDKLTSGEFTGILKSVPGSDRMFTLEVQTNQLIPTNRRIRGTAARSNRLLSLQNQLNNAQGQLARAKSVKQRNSAMARIVRLQVQLNNAITRAVRAGTIPQGYRVKVVTNQIDFQAMETVKVRTMVLPEQFDDKGKPRKYTREELNALKGKDRNLVGYESSLEKLEVNQTLTVSLTPVKKSSPPKTAQADKNKDLDKDLDKEDGEKKMQVKLIVIKKEAPDMNPPAKGKKNN
jgi:hypothetical protein